jgi:RHS repeat-associated protein
LLFRWNFVYENTTLAYFGTPEGRVLYTGGKLQPQYIITDQQGNARVTFINNDGAAKVIQENSYYAFGLVMTGGITPTDPNKNLYNGGSEWQDDFGDLPDLMQAYYRNYDQALGRWTGVDPDAEGVESLTSYNYSANNPVMFNDPLGNLMEQRGAQASQKWLNDHSVYDEEGNFNPYRLGYLASGGSAANSPEEKQNQALAAGTPINLFDSNGNLIFQQYDNGVLGYYTHTGTRYYYANQDNKNSNKYNKNYNFGNEEDTWEFHGIMDLANQGGGQQYLMGAVGGPVPWYGNFLGPGPDRNPYQLKGYNGRPLKPIDMVDAAAQRHDLAYYNAHISGVKGALFDDAVGAADRQLAASAHQIDLMYNNGINDSITNRPISLIEYRWALRVEVAFGFLGGLKWIGNTLGH